MVKRASLSADRCPRSRLMRLDIALVRRYGSNPMDEAGPLEKLRKVEALFAGATTIGERQAAQAAIDRITARLRKWRGKEPDIEFRCSLGDRWSQRLFTALCRRYGLKPYRYYRRRRTTLMVKAPRSFMDQTLWPEYEELSRELQTYLSDVTDRVIGEAIHGDDSDADEVEEPRMLGGGESTRGG